LHTSTNSKIQIDQSHLDLISNIYDLPLNPDGWQSVLDQFLPVMNAAGAAIYAFDPSYSEHNINSITSNYDLHEIAEYFELYGEDERAVYAREVIDPKRGFVSDKELLGISHEEHIQRPDIRWLEEHYNVRHRAVSCLNTQRIWSDMIVVQHSNDREQITDHEKEIGRYFLDHFAKTIELSRAFGVLKSRFDGVLTALDRFHIGIFVLSPNGSVVVKNLEADRILDAGDGLALSRDGYLQPAGDGERGEMKEIITRAVSTAQAQDNRAEQLMTIARRSGDDPYLVEVSPIRDRGEIESAFKGALVFVIDPNKTDVVSTEGMQTLYQLTGAESEICKLIAEGMETDDIADVRKNTRETVRTYIKQILQKTGVNSRSQLVRLALNVNLPIDTATDDK